MYNVFPLVKFLKNLLPRGKQIRLKIIVSLFFLRRCGTFADQLVRKVILPVMKS